MREEFVRGHLRPRAGERILDLGCGPADVAPLLGDVEYVGVDASAAYVAAARRRVGAGGRVHLASVLEFDPGPAGSFDAVIAIGLLHHLDDIAAARAFELGARALGKGGRMLTIDPCELPGLPWVARRLISLDRGSEVRSPEGYRALAERHFGMVEVSARQGLARVPYAHAILDARQPLPPAEKP